MQIRLNKYLADAGCCSRRKADEYIQNGAVTVNGVQVKELGRKVDPDADSVEFRGKAVKPAENFVYYALFKPKGVISSAKSERDEPAVTDLVPKSPRVYPAGRLDKNSEGLIILTNDGELTKELTHPRYKHEKEYDVEARIMNKELRIKPEQIKSRFEKGIFIDGHLMKANLVLSKELPNSRFEIRVILHTGYNRQIRKMCAKIGLEVVKLTRVRLNKLRLDDLDIGPGDYREITRDMIL